MNRDRLWYRVATVLVALVIVGTVRSLIPDFLPDESPRSPRGDGVVTLDDMLVELTDVQLTRSVVDPVNEVRFDTDEVFIVVRLRLQPTAGRVNPSYRLESRDGTTYDHLKDGIAEFGYVHPVQPATVAHRTLMFEVPESQASNLELVVVNPHLGRVVPMKPVAVFGLGDLGEPRDRFVATPDDEELADG